MVGIYSGSEDAFDFLFRKYYRKLCSVAIMLLKDDDLSQSIVQECFISFWEKRNTVKEINNIYGFLSFMVRNKSLDYLRKMKAEQSAVNKMYEDFHENSENEHYELSELEQRILEILNNMPERARMAFQYSRYDGLKYTEIADKMNITTKAVEALVSRALKTLRIELKDYLPFFVFMLNFIKK
ncbi:MAG: RNA polymerase sigma-70 factor [Chlorobi bacterium]|nr:RNA polymerase sigma-70 factor [Chlorobiota bacterium]